MYDFGNVSQILQIKKVYYTLNYLWHFLCTNLLYSSLSYYIRTLLNSELKLLIDIDNWDINEWMPKQSEEISYFVVFMALVKLNNYIKTILWIVLMIIYIYTY